MPASLSSGQAATLRIEAEVRGMEQVEQLTTQLEILKASVISNATAKKIMTAQTRIEIETMKQSNQMLLAKSKMNKRELTALATQTNLQEQYNYTIANNLKMEQQALLVKKMYAEAGIKITMEEARTHAVANAEIIQSEIAKQKVMMETRKALMAASISMFVLNISMGQLVTSMKPFVEGNEDAERTLKDVAGALQFSMAPLQAYMSLQMISTSLAASQKVAFMGVATSLGAIFFFYQAITAKSAGMRAAYAALAVVLTAVAVASWLAAYGTASLKAALTGNIIPLIAVTAGLAAAMGAVAYVTAPKAQTLTGHRKRVRKGGLAELDDDEVVQRISKDGTKSGGGGDTIIMLPESYNGSMADAKITAHTVKRMQNGGYGSVKYTRKVVAGG